jgi:chemotaxis protein MotA
MLAVAGILVVAVSVLGGFVLEGGPLALLFQPVEWLIICGTASGALVIGTSRQHLRQLAQGLRTLVLDQGRKRDLYLDVLRLQYELFVNVKKHGFIALERDVTEPDKSSIFSKYTTFLERPHAVTFLVDSVRLLVDGGVSPYDLEALLDREIETHHDEASKPSLILAKMGDTLPGLGIVTAVLGIIIAMQFIDGGAAEIGHRVAVALVGTLTGVGLAYGLINPLAAGLETVTEKELNYLHCIKAGVVAFAKGAAPFVAVEFARRAIFTHERPSLVDVEASTLSVSPRPA